MTMFESIPRKHWRYLQALGVVVYLYFFLGSFYPKSQNQRVRETMPDLAPAAHFLGRNICVSDPDTLGAVSMSTREVEMTTIQRENPHIMTGGRWTPANCKPRQTVAILIPYRDRWEHLKVLLRRLHPMLQKQRISYQIFVIEQAGNDKYNKGMLYNIGVKEALKLHPFNCFIFHDVDLLPENDKNIYYCDDHLRHFSSAINEWRYTLMYSDNAGGVVALNYENFVLINGFSNIYWGWGGEDDDFSARARELGLLLTRPPQHIARYYMIRHKKRTRDVNAESLFFDWKARWETDGLNSINKTSFKILSTIKKPLYTWFLVDVGKPPRRPIFNVTKRMNPFAID